MKTLSLEASKKLQDRLKDVETEYVYSRVWYIPWDNKKHYEKDDFTLTKSFNSEDRDYDEWGEEIYKALNLQECLDMLPKYIWPDKLIIEAMWSGWVIRYLNFKLDTKNLYKVAWDTLLESIEKMLLYLDENNLLDEIENSEIVARVAWPK